MKTSTRAADTTFREFKSAMLLSLCVALFAVALNGCAQATHVETYRAPEARYNTYYGPDYYPYYPWYGYYGGAYYYGD